MPGIDVAELIGGAGKRTPRIRAVLWNSVSSTFLADQSPYSISGGEGRRRSWFDSWREKTLMFSFDKDKIRQDTNNQIVQVVNKGIPEKRRNNMHLFMQICSASTSSLTSNSTHVFVEVWHCWHLGCIPSYYKSWSSWSVIVKGNDALMKAIGKIVKAYSYTINLQLGHTWINACILQQCSFLYPRLPCK